ncbi:MAG: hypothetical protein QM534_13450 [Sediminibacterium sp.]|nr:hypothetical protein [Sediminibacterium sp.]
MDIQSFEQLLKNELASVIEKILNDTPTLPIDVRQGERVGDAISKFLEAKFEEYTQEHFYFKDTKPSPPGKTKNPWDAQTFFEVNGHRELLWIDFKAVNTDNDNSNPDSGTPNKVFELMFKHNSFYLVYIVVYYKGLGTGLGLKFDEKNGRKVKPIFLKDVEDNMHITPSNQIQFNVFADEKIRTRNEFISFFKDKLIEANQRRIDDAQAKLELIIQGKYSVPKTIYKEQEFNFIILNEINDKQEEKIREIKNL